MRRNSFGRRRRRKKKVPIPGKARERFESMILRVGCVGGKDAFGAKVEIVAAGAFVTNANHGLVLMEKENF